MLIKHSLLKKASGGNGETDSLFGQLTIGIGFCVPSSCSREEVFDGLTDLLGANRYFLKFQKLK